MSAELERLLPPGPPVTCAQLLEELGARGRAPADRPYLLVNMIATLDGRASLQGSTKGLGGPADLELLLELRTIADAVLVGAGTLAAEGYKRLVIRAERRARRRAAGLAEDPVAVIASRSLRLPWDAEIFAAEGQPIVIYTASDAEVPRVRARMEVLRLEAVTPEGILGDLRRRGIELVVSEGGPTLLRSLLEAGAVDELFLTLASAITADGSQPAIVAPPALPAAVRARLAWVLRHGDELFLRYRLAYGSHGSERPG